MNTEFNQEEYNRRLEIIKRSVNACVEILKEIHPNIDTQTYEKGDETWNIKERLCLGLQFELMFFEGFNKCREEVIKLMNTKTQP